MIYKLRKYLKTIGKNFRRRNRHRFYSIQAKLLFGYNLIVFFLILIFTGDIEKSLETTSVTYLWSCVGSLLSYFLLIKRREKEYSLELKKFRHEIRKVKNEIKALFK